MTRTDYIIHTEKMRRRVNELIQLDDDIRSEQGHVNDETSLEIERRTKTRKLLEQLADRLYEDGAVSERVQQDMEAAGCGEQQELKLTRRAK